MKALRSLLFLMLLIASCSTYENLQELRLLDSNTKERVSQIGMSQNSTKITPEEAAIVAYIDRFGAIQTKSEIRTAVSSTSPILGEISQKPYFSRLGFYFTRRGTQTGIS